MKDTIVLYHKNCSDGFGAAYAAWCELQDTALYIPVQYGDNLVDIIEEAKAELDDCYYLLMVDFSCEPQTLIDISVMNGTLKVTVIDHHESAVRKLQDNEEFIRKEMDEGCDLELIFDMERSGAVMTWDFFFPNVLAPMELRMIQDRDLWKWEIPESRAFSEALFMQEFDFDVWDNLFGLKHYAKGKEFPENKTDKLVEVGEALIQKQKSHVDSIQKHAVKKAIENWFVPCVNSSYCFASDIGNDLSLNAPFAAIFSIDLGTNRLFFSLRSSEKNKLYVNVAEIAEKFGGGGHKHAAGFSVPLDSVHVISWLASEGNLKGSQCAS